MHRIVGKAMFVFAAAAPNATSAVVDCDRGDSLNQSLSRLSTLARVIPVTVSVRGTCTEYVLVRGFDNLTLKGLPGATLVKPSTPPETVLVGGALTIDASRSVTVDGLAVDAGAGPAIAIRGGSSDVRLRALSIVGWTYVYEGSQASLAGLTVRTAAWTGLAIVDLSHVHMEDCLFEKTGSGWSSGVFVGKAALAMHGTAMRDFTVGIQIGPGGIVDTGDFGTFIPVGGPTEVRIENAVGTNQYGCQVNGGKLTLSSALRITNAGQQGWGAGMDVAQGGALQANGHLQVAGSLNHGLVVQANSVASLGRSTITGSVGQGVLVHGDSVVNLGNSTITGGLRGGLVAVNQSVVMAGGATLSGNGTDVYCDSTSLITGGASVVGATSIQCDHLLPGDFESPLP